MSTPEIESLLDTLRLANMAAYEIVQQVRQVVQAEAPESHERIMYGGLMFVNNGTDWGGVFAYKNHVSFEFSKGAQLKNTPAFLEGKGKLRRHLKLGAVDDIAAKQLAKFIAQALNQP
ncbi:MAG TPA: DUF1801 domain-containing protein [Rhodobacteraceae bacterium]|nr:DUF1801 domain-containing protein [Paracoccaceae bacterium]